MDKWKAVRMEVAEEEELEAEEERPQSVEEMDISRKARLAEWKKAQAQLVSGEANANFQPLAGGDWRERIARKRQKR